MAPTIPPARDLVLSLRQRLLTRLTPLLLFVTALLLQAGCTCVPDRAIPAPRPLLACRPHAPSRPLGPPRAVGTSTVAAGTLPQSFAITDDGSAALSIPLTVVPGRAGVEPELSLDYRSDAVASDGVLGAGFSLSGVSSITRCASTLAQDGEIRGVRYDAADRLCWSGQRLVVTGDQPSLLEFRTFPDTFTRIVGHYAREADKPGNALSFQVFLPSGLVIDLGTHPSSKPLALGGVPRAWLADEVRDGRATRHRARLAVHAEQEPLVGPALERDRPGRWRHQLLRAA